MFVSIKAVGFLKLVVNFSDIYAWFLLYLKQ